VRSQDRVCVCVCVCVCVGARALASKSYLSLVSRRSWSSTFLPLVLSPCFFSSARSSATVMSSLGDLILKSHAQRNQSIDRLRGATARIQAVVTARGQLKDS
jgi:hypothetical protein